MGGKREAGGSSPLPCHLPRRRPPRPRCQRHKRHQQPATTTTTTPTPKEVPLKTGKSLPMVLPLSLPPFEPEDIATPPPQRLSDAMRSLERSKRSVSIYKAEDMRSERIRFPPTNPGGALSALTQKANSELASSFRCSLLSNEEAEDQYDSDTMSGHPGSSSEALQSDVDRIMDMLNTRSQLRFDVPAPMPREGPQATSTWRGSHLTFTGLSGLAGSGSVFLNTAKRGEGRHVRRDMMEAPKKTIATSTFISKLRDREMLARLLEPSQEQVHELKERLRRYPKRSPSPPSPTLNSSLLSSWNRSEEAVSTRKRIKEDHATKVQLMAELRRQEEQEVVEMNAQLAEEAVERATVLRKTGKLKQRQQTWLILMQTGLSLQYLEQTVRWISEEKQEMLDGNHALTHQFLLSMGDRATPAMRVKLRSMAQTVQRHLARWVHRWRYRRWTRSTDIISTFIQSFTRGLHMVRSLLGYRRTVVRIQRWVRRCLVSRSGRRQILELQWRKEERTLLRKAILGPSSPDAQDQPPPELVSAVQGEVIRSGETMRCSILQRSRNDHSILFPAPYVRKVVYHTWFNWQAAMRSRLAKGIDCSNYLPVADYLVGTLQSFKPPKNTTVTFNV
eukprot:Sspe_Gene.46660::Locus_23389_Transcript_1_1_Confidence_1.000_Length_2007::g.46660::m.46660